MYQSQQKNLTKLLIVHTERRHGRKEGRQDAGIDIFPIKMRIFSQITVFIHRAIPALTRSAFSVEEIRNRIR